ncbi:SRPBCC family protein [Okeania sp. SIO2G5]|uniref:SRPBCC family protein n=1 Tax=Okeania sp. SIO2G5 TaxID=2607796 RepID=UPI0013C27120|nr:SRPBCC family protein [Okeania sp. SIO2G5]NEP76583.1 hypothetical protein [Okeania sp. SIO2G5]
MALPSVDSSSGLSSFDELISPLPTATQYLLRQGQAVVTPAGRRFITRVLVPTTTDIVWDTITDYVHFSRFLPTVVSSRILKSEGNRHTVEQIDSRTILLAPVRTRVCTENTEIPKKRINFRLVEGDMKTMEGHWQLYAVDTTDRPNVEQILLVHSAEVDAGSVFFEGIVHGLVMDSLKANVAAIRDEAVRRSH